MTDLNRSMKRRLAIVAAVIPGALVPAAAAEGHTGGDIFWSERNTEYSIVQRFDDADDTTAVCQGYGRSRLWVGVRHYRHLYCELSWFDADDGEYVSGEGTFHARRQRLTFSFNWYGS